MGYRLRLYQCIVKSFAPIYHLQMCANYRAMVRQFEGDYSFREILDNEFPIEWLEKLFLLQKKSLTKGIY